MRYDLVEAHRGRWPVRLMCRVLRVSPGGYYDWRGRPASVEEESREALVVAIKAVHARVKARYGSPRDHAELAARGVLRCVNTVARLMREHGIAARTRREFRRTTDSNHDRRWPRTSWAATSSRPRSIEPGRPTSPTSRRARGGSIWRRWRTCIRGESSAGRCPSGSTAGLSWTPCRWPWRLVGPARAWWPTRIGAASMPASTTGE